MKKLNIAQISPIDESVPPEKYGATEFMVYNLTEELVKRGHTVYLFATENSKTSGKLLPFFPKNFRKYPEHYDSKWKDKVIPLCVGRILKDLSKIKVDIIHNHWGTIIAPFLPIMQAPAVSTMHTPIGFYNKYSKLVYENFAEANYVSISDNQRKAMPELHYVGTVYHGIDIKNYEFSEKRGDYFAFLGRTSPEKGIKEAILLAKKTGITLKIAAKSETDKEYFVKEVEPLIDNKQIQFIGEVDLKGKNEFLKNAIGLIAPIQWEEPFGLVFIEAMACGVPVISFARGSVPEIVVHGKTGFVSQVNNMDDMAKNIRRLNEMPNDEYAKMRYNARRHVEEKFTVEKMTDGYEKIYYDILRAPKQ